MWPTFYVQKLVVSTFSLFFVVVGVFDWMELRPPQQQKIKHIFKDPK